jgi:predicted Zn-dependent peptidase
MLAPAPSIDDERRYAASMLASVLGDVEGSRLYWALIETGMADEAQAQYEGHDGLGDYFVYASCSPEQSDDVEQTIRHEIEALVGSLSEDDLERTRNKVATAATLAGELPAGRMRRLGRVWTYRGLYQSLEEELAALNAVTLDEIRAVHDDFPLTPKLTARLAPA